MESNHQSQINSGCLRLKPARRIEVRMTDEERDLEQAAAAARGQTLSGFVRQAARHRFLSALDDPASFEAGLGALTERPSVLDG